MKFSENAMSAILLCSYLGIGNDDAFKPLTLKEWNEFLDRAAQCKQPPSAIMDEHFLNEIGCHQEYIERIKRLISRGGAVAFALDDLERKGIDIVTQFDADYPILIKRKLKRKAPPVFFYSGDIGLAKKIGIGVVGSRNVDEEGVQFTQELVKKAAKEHLVIYSGGAKGIDTVSERAAIDYGSASVSFVADSLLLKIRKKEILDAIIDKKQLLLSDVKPDAGFSAARAMNRNKYIYASSYGTFVITSDYNTGGTWTGATEALKNQWTKVLVWQNKNYEGNCKLIEKGAVPYQPIEESLFALITKKKESFQQMDMLSLLSEASKNPKESADEVKEKGNGQEKAAEGLILENGQEKAAEGLILENGQEKAAEGLILENGQEELAEILDSENGAEKPVDLYYVVVPYVLEHIGDGMTKEEAAQVFQVAKGQMHNWLKKMCEDSYLKCVKGRYIKP